MTRSAKRILIVDDDAALRSQMKWAFDDMEIFEAGGRKEAIALVRRTEPDVVLLDLGLPPTPHETSEGFLALEAMRIDRHEFGIDTVSAALTISSRSPPIWMRCA